MSMTIGAPSGALSYLQQLLQYGSNGVAATSIDPLLTLGQAPTGVDSSSQSQATTSPIGSGCGSSFDPGTLAALVSLQGQSASSATGQAPSDLFSQLDLDGDGQISKADFEQALGNVGVDTQSADALFSRLDTNGDGNVSQSELAKARGHGHHHHHVDGSTSSQNDGSQQSGLDSLLNSTDITGATTQTTTNSDGSTTTTISYADGTTVSMNTPAAPQNNSSSNDGSAGGSSSGAGNNNLIEELIRLQSQLLTQATSAISTIA